MRSSDGFLGFLALAFAACADPVDGDDGDEDDDAPAIEPTADDAETYAQKSIELSCHIMRHCLIWQWNTNGYETIDDCVADTVPPDYPTLFADNCPLYDAEAGAACLQQQLDEWELCTPAHDYNDPNFDEADDPCLNVCP